MPLREDIDFAASRAVLVGTSEYTNGLSQIPAAANSLAAMRAVLSEPCEWPDASVEEFANRNIRDGVVQDIAELIHAANDVLIFYYVGHGQLLPGGDLGLALSDTSADPRMRMSSSLRLSQLREELKYHCTARIKIIILDCCFSGIATRPAMGPDDLAAQVEQAAKIEGSYTWTASRASQEAFFEGHDGGLTYFTKILTEIVSNGVAGGGLDLTLADIHNEVERRFIRLDLPDVEVRPEPTRLAVDNAERFVFARNVFLEKKFGTRSGARSDRSTSEGGTIVTFYPAGGGTGSTMALANIAWILAANGNRVLAVDWCLDSPGLHRYFHPFLPPAAAAAGGVNELIASYVWLVHQSGERPEGAYRDAARILPYTLALDWPHFPEQGRLDLLPAGKHDTSLTPGLSRHSWNDFYEKMGGDLFLDAMRQDMKASYDYILIDSASGLSDIADICTAHFPDILLDCFTPSSKRRIDFAASVARRIRDRGGDRPVRILPVPMRVPEGDKELLDRARRLAVTSFEEFLTEMDEDRRSEYWYSIEIPYRPYYAYEAILATFGDDPGSPASMLAAYERLTAEITRGKVSWLPPMEDRLRRENLAKFTDSPEL